MEKCVQTARSKPGGWRNPLDCKHALLWANRMSVYWINNHCLSNHLHMMQYNNACLLCMKGTQLLSLGHILALLIKVQWRNTS